MAFTCEDSLSEQKVTNLFTAIIGDPTEQSHRVFVTGTRAMLNFWVILQKRNVIAAANTVYKCVTHGASATHVVDVNVTEPTETKRETQQIHV